MCFLNYSYVTSQATFLTNKVASVVLSAESLTLGGFGGFITAASGYATGSSAFFRSSIFIDLGFMISSLV